jgi:hypothetical protein
LNDITVSIYPDKRRKQQALAIWFACILIVTFGVYLTSIQFYNIEWLTRSGCVVVLFGIWSGMKGIIEERVIAGRIDVQRRIALSRAKRKSRKIKAPKEYVEKEIASIELAYERKIDELRDTVRLHLGMVEVSLLMTGTFIWGFGDLLFKVVAF